MPREGPWLSIYASIYLEYSSIWNSSRVKIVFSSVFDRICKLHVVVLEIRFEHFENIELSRCNRPSWFDFDDSLESFRVAWKFAAS